jgi:hypothetical protein
MQTFVHNFSAKIQENGIMGDFMQHIPNFIHQKSLPTRPKRIFLDGGACVL